MYFDVVPFSMIVGCQDVVLMLTSTMFPCQPEFADLSIYLYIYIFQIIVKNYSLVRLFNTESEHNQYNIYKA